MWLARSIAAGATIAVTGPATNLAALELAGPGRLRGARVVMMGGWLGPPAAGLPAWGPERDTNVQTDSRALELVLRAGCDLTLVTLPATLGVPLRAADLDAVRAVGPAGALLAHQTLAWAAQTQKAEVGATAPGLPDDLVNFQHDPVTAAVAAGWSGVTGTRVRVRPVTDVEGVLRLEPDDDGTELTAVTAVDADAFRPAWLGALARLAHPPVAPHPPDRRP